MSQVIAPGRSGAVLELSPYGKTATFLVSEARGYRSREQVTVKKGGKYPDGTVLKIDDEKYAPFDGSGDASAILYETIDATDNDVVVTVIARDAEVQRAMLKFVGDVGDAQKDAAYASLVQNHIVMR